MVLSLLLGAGCADGGDGDEQAVDDSACGQMAAGTDAWEELPEPPVLLSPAYATSAWTGEDFIIFDNSAYARYRPATNEWLPVSDEGAPKELTGGSMTAIEGGLLVLGTVDCAESADDCHVGAIYHPGEDVWEPFEVEAPRVFYIGATIWAGDALYTWGAWDFDDAGMRSVRIHEGGRLDWATRTWEAMPVENAPEGDGLATWTGSKLVKWGGVSSDRGIVDGGAVFDPVEWTWRPMAPAPIAARNGDTAAWSGQEVLIWGGASMDEYFRDGAAYDPETDAWRLVGESGAPSGRSWHVGEWTGTSMVVWGGMAKGREACANGGAFTPESGAWEPIASPSWFHGRFDSQAAWTGSELLVWGGRIPMDESRDQAGVFGGARWKPN